jgi:hypothetical protein
VVELHRVGRHHDVKPGGIDGLLRFHAEIERVNEHLHLALRMVVEPDAAQQKLRHAATEHHARQDRVPCCVGTLHAHRRRSPVGDPLPQRIKNPRRRGRQYAAAEAADSLWPPTCVGG